MMVSKLNDARNKVLNVLVLNKSKMVDNATGLVTKDSCNAACQKFGAGVYVPKLTTTKNEPLIGANYDEAGDYYFNDQPFSSWTFDVAKLEWRPPYAFDEQVHSTAGYNGFKWKEATRKFHANKPATNNNDWIYDEVAGTWSDTGEAWVGPGAE